MSHYTNSHMYRSSLRPGTLFKNRLWHRCFSVNFAKFLKTAFFKEHLRWLLLYVKEIGRRTFNAECFLSLIGQGQAHCFKKNVRHIQRILKKSEIRNEVVTSHNKLQQNYVKRYWSKNECRGVFNTLSKNVFLPKQ